MPESLIASLPEGMRENANDLLPIFLEHGLHLGGAHYPCFGLLGRPSRKQLYHARIG